MNKISLLALILWPIIAVSQNLTIAPAHLVCDYDIPEKLDTQVKTKLQRSLTSYGISSEPGVARFTMVPSVAIIDERTTTTIPVFCDVDFDFVVTLQDAYSGTVFASFTKETSSRGTNKANAIAKGISSIRLDGPDFIRFCDEAKRKVYDYYEEQMSAIISKAKQAASNRDYQEAIFLLAEIPEECTSYDSRVLPLMTQYFKQETDLYGERILAEARAVWAAEPNEHGAARVAEILSNIPPSCSSSTAARQFVNQITNKIEELEQWERNYQERELAYKHDERKATIAAAQAIAVAYASNQPRYITKVYLWR